MISKTLRIPRFLWRKLHLWSLTQGSGGRVRIAPNARIASPGRIHLIGQHSSIEIEEGVSIEEDTWLNVAGHLSIGEGSYISVRGLVGCESVINIGKRVAIGPNVTIIDTNKNYANLSLPIMDQGSVSREISIGDDCWLGANTVILPGVRLGSHVVVGAGSVVNKSFPDNVVVGGAPAKILKQL
jgi:acetyltransferase-like isoleucine patch superfamily enzyme